MEITIANFDVKHKSGKSNSSDIMSKHPNINEANRTDYSDGAEEFVNYISESAILKPSPKRIQMCIMSYQSREIPKLKKIVR